MILKNKLGNKTIETNEKTKIAQLKAEGYTEFDREAARKKAKAANAKLDDRGLPKKKEEAKAAE